MSIFFRIGRSPPPATETGGCATTIRAVGTEGGRIGICPAPRFLADQLPLSQPGGRLCPPHYYMPPPPGFSDPRTVLHTTTLLILPYNHRHNRKIMRRVAVGRASASKELCCASRSIRFACNDHRRGHSKTILIGFFTFFDQLLPPNLYVNIFKGGYTSKKNLSASYTQTKEKLSAHRQYAELFLSV